MKYFIPLISLGLTACSAATSSEPATAPELSTDIESRIISMADINKDDAPWGTFYPHFAGTTYGTNPVLAGVANINVGDQIHPPHRHADEEFLMVTKGTGTWYLNGETFPAKEGDMLYAKPWDYHGVKAAPDSALQFVVFKWSNKGLSPTDPDPSLPEELAE
jgi:mannose-6-phosphate isomerase-like protein (cupin superfamily)